MNRQRKIILGKILAILSVIPALVYAHYSGPDPGKSGVPGESTCNESECHVGTGLNAGGGGIQISTDSSTYTPGVKQRINVTVSDSKQRRWGFQLTARLASNSKTMAGVLKSIDSTTFVACSGSNLAEQSPCPPNPVLHYIEHTWTSSMGPSGGFTAVGAGYTFHFDWTPPSTDVGDIILYAAGNAANGNGEKDGDHIYTTTLRLSPPATTPISTGPQKLLPQLAFGGGWYSALYFANTSGTALAFTVNFIGDDGKPLTLPSVGNTSTTVNLAAWGTAIIEAPNSGSLQQGYVSTSLPTDVTAYGIFRASNPGVGDQEAVVPLASGTAVGSTLIWDETNFVTAVSIVNPSSADSNVMVTVRDSGGTVIGTSSIALAAGKKTAVALSSLPGLDGMKGKRGSADFSATTGNVAVLGLRFGGSAFTSIPTTER